MTDFIGTPGPDIFVGTDGNDKLKGLGGDDQLSGGAGDDLVFGGAGNDSITIAPDGGVDVLKGGKGTDTLILADGPGLTPPSSVYANIPNGTLAIAGQLGPSTISGFEVFDASGVTYPFYVTASGPITVIGGAFRNSLVGSNKMDHFTGGIGDDYLALKRGNDTGIGGAGKDEIIGGGGWDNIKGGKGNDTLSGQKGNDLIEGGKGHDLIKGGAGNDELHGDEGKDELKGGNGDDVLYGGPGNDIVEGGNGDDRLFGGDGDDLLTGGAGADTFSFIGSEKNFETLIGDFNIAQGDKLDLESLGLETRAEVLAKLVTDPGMENSVVIVHEGNRIILDGVTADDLQSSTGWLVE